MTCSRPLTTAPTSLCVRVDAQRPHRTRGDWRQHAHDERRLHGGTPSPGSNAHSVSTAAIVRRHTSAVAEINEMWLNASSPLLLANWPTAENDDYSLQTLLEDPRWTGRRLTAVLPRDDDEAGGPSSMLIRPERLAVWWSWWTCEAKGHGTIDLGRARQSHCCKPGDLESHARGAAL